MTIAQQLPDEAPREHSEVAWDEAVVYQVYLRSFSDGDGDGIGDLAGLRSRLAHIARLGCDAVWLNPCYASPQRDHGYDVADYMAVDPAYGDLEDFDAFVQDAHAHGLRVLMDMVANHCSIEHPWFEQALRAAPGSAERDRFIFRDGRGADGERPPGNWESVFGGSAWTRVTEPGGRPGQWYLHSFDPGQPDFNWRNPGVNDYFERVLRFWFDRGVDGFRIDVAHGMFKAEGLPDLRGAGHNAAMWDQPEVHEVYRAWRRIAAEYQPERFFVGEIWVPSAESLAAYLRPDELQQAFNFEMLVQPWDAERMRAAIDSGRHAAGGRPAWVLANHDVHRSATRYGQRQLLDAPDPSDMIAAARRRGDVDIAVGRRRAAAAAALLLALPGAAYVYQGEELGLPEAFDLPNDARQDPIWHRTAGVELGRDGCRVPLPWSERGANLGFSPERASEPWLPQPEWMADYAVEKQLGESGSMLSLYRELLVHRRTLFVGAGDLEWMHAPDAVLAFRRDGSACVVNFGDRPFDPPPHWGFQRRVIVTTPHDAGGLAVPGDSAAWFSI